MDSPFLCLTFQWWWKINDFAFQLIETVLKSFEPKNRSEYLWYLQFTVVVLLLNDLPVSIYTLQGHLLTKCFSPSTSLWDSNPVKVRQSTKLNTRKPKNCQLSKFQVDYFADHLYDIIENNKNLIFVTSQIENRSSLGFHLSLCMLWKSIYRCIDEEKSMFRLYPVSDVSQPFGFHSEFHVFFFSSSPFPSQRISLH